MAAPAGMDLNHARQRCHVMATSLIVLATGRRFGRWPVARSYFVNTSYCEAFAFVKTILACIDLALAAS